MSKTRSTRTLQFKFVHFGGVKFCAKIIFHLKISLSSREPRGRALAKLVGSQLKQEILTISLKVLDGFNGESGKTNEDKNSGFSKIDLSFSWAHDGIFRFFMLSLFNFWPISKVPLYPKINNFRVF